MFSENNRISERQAFRLLTYDLLGLSTLLVPGMLGKIAGRDGIFCIAIGTLVSILYLWILKEVEKDCTTTFPVYLEQKLGKVLGVLVQVCIFVYLLLLAAYTAYLFADAVLQSLLREESFYLVLVLVLLLVLYGLWGGIEGRARVYEILFWILMIPLFLMLLFAMDEICTDYWIPVFTSDVRAVLGGSYYVFSCFAIIFLVLFLGNYMEKKEQIFRVGKKALLFTGGIHAVLYLVLTGVFGASALGNMQYPAVTLMSTVRISGAFFKRTDAFMFTVWFFTLYALLASCLFYSGTVLAQLSACCLKKYGEKKRENGAYVVVAVAACIVACCFYKSYSCMEYYRWFLWYIGTPFLVLLPVLLWIKKCIKTRTMARSIGGICLILLGSSVLTGCTAAELEERNFPIEIAVENTEQFARDFLDEESAGNRMMDYSHLKVMIVSQKFVENEEAMQELLNVLQQKNEIPQSTYLVIAENVSDIMETEEELGESAGWYIEEMFDNVSEIKVKAYPTLGMLYKEQENQNETLYIPCVRKADKALVVDRYYVWRRGSGFGSVEVQTAMLSLFSQNLMDKYKLVLADGTIVVLSNAQNEIAFSGKSGTREIVAKIRCDGEVMSKEAIEGQPLQQIESEIQEYMNQHAKQTLVERQIDVTNSFRKLGAQRDWYSFYQKRRDAYEQDIRIRYDVSIDWINL